MTTGIILSTLVKEKEVYEAVKKVGFKKPQALFYPYIHKSVDGLVLQIIKGNPILMEFEDYDEKFPQNPQAIYVLRNLYVQLPDLMYREYAFPQKSIPDGTLSEYLKNL